MKRVLILTTILLVSQFARGQCTPLTGYWTEGFENMNCQMSFQPQQCWTEYSPNQAIRWGIDCASQWGHSASSPYSGSKYAYFEASAGGPGIEAELITPEFLINGISSPALSFYYHMHGSDMGTFRLEISKDHGVNWDTIWSVSGEQHSASTTPWPLN